jgi:hypothetical protein
MGVPPLYLLPIPGRGCFPEKDSTKTPNARQRADHRQVRSLPHNCYTTATKAAVRDREGNAVARCQETENTCLGTGMLAVARMKARLSRKESFEPSAITASTPHLTARSTAERSET